MSKIVVHIHSGPDLVNKATLGLLVAVTAVNKGWEATLYLAADGVHLMGCSEREQVV